MNTAIILAAGQSRRMGQPKQLLPFGLTTMLECVIAAIAVPLIDRIVVVLGHEANRIAARITAAPVTVVMNAEHERGMFSSVQTGLRALSTEPDLVLIVLGDQPRLQQATVTTLVTDFRQQQRRILVPIHDQRRGHPLLFAGCYVPEILTMEPSLTLKHFLARHSAEVATLSVADDGILADIDDPATYERERRRMSEN